MQTIKRSIFRYAQTEAAGSPISAGYTEHPQDKYGYKNSLHIRIVRKTAKTQKPALVPLGSLFAENNKTNRQPMQIYLRKSEMLPDRYLKAAKRKD